VKAAVILTKMVPAIAVDAGRNWRNFVQYAAARTKMPYFATTADRHSQKK
ncbi:uncharacterized protein METZ01_LOCUS105876, partial [marine metagenome]